MGFLNLMVKYNVWLFFSPLHSTQMGVANKTTGTMFTPVNVEIQQYEAEQVAGKHTFFNLIVL